MTELEQKILDVLEKYGEAEQTASKTYLTTLTDFVKWTTTITLAAVVWIANTLSSSSQVLQISGVLALLLLVFSLLFAVIGIKHILDVASNEWDIERILHHRAYLRLATVFRTNDETSEKVKLNELERQLNAALAVRKKYRESKFFKLPVTLHATLLALGVATYGVGQFILVLIINYP